MNILNVEQGSLDWHIERAGRVGGTSLESAIGARFDAKKSKWVIDKTASAKKKQKTLCFELIAERMTEVQITELNNAAVERGRELEPLAILAASKKTGEDYQDCGMMISEITQELGVSPDSVVYDGEVIVGGLETKCPSSKKHVEYIINNEVPKEYFWQVLAPFLCSDDIKWWDFASYDDRNYELPLFTIRTGRDEHVELINEAKDALVEFLTMVRETHESMVF